MGDGVARSGSDVEVRDAATVLLVRDGHAGLEVFMLRRNLESTFVGGAYVFPGGAVDPADRAADLEAISVGRTDAEASRRLGIDRGGLAYWVAAIREGFEEAGILLAYDRDGRIVDLDSPEHAARWIEHRRAVDRGEVTMVDLCVAEDLTLAVDGMHYFGHWITPVGSPRRYDTRFFVAAEPPGQTPLHDDHEVIANDWFRPADALDRAARGELTMLPPTVASLRALARFETAADALRAATEIVDVPRILPRIIEVDGGARIALPGDDGYEGAPLLADGSIGWDDLRTAGTTGFGREPT
jgi:8-oxo-dGTP pyrophosphatase MutT (NUDIX family)